MLLMGSKVYWCSQAAGKTKKKIGTIIAVIPKNVDFQEYEKDLILKYNCISKFGGGECRNHTSFAILVEQSNNCKPKLYWPKVNKLHLYTAQKFTAV